MTVLLPAVVDVRVQLAAPPLSEPVVQLSVPSLIVTVPVGVAPEPVALATLTATAYPTPTGVANDKSVVIVVVVLALLTVSVPLAFLSIVTVNVVVAGGVVFCVVIVNVKLLGVQTGLLLELQVTLPAGEKVPVTPAGKPDTDGVAVWLPLPFVLRVTVYVA